MIPYGRQQISDADIQAVVEVLKSDYLTQGPAVPAFEKAVAAYCGAGHAVAVNSATSALHLACLALGVQAGDQVWTTPITFVASANCALYCGAAVDFVDIDPETFNISVQALQEKLHSAEQCGCLPKVVIAVHLCGLSCDMAAIHRLSKRYGFRIIEDASHAIGGKYQNQPIGNCRYSDISVFSFHPVKIITTGEGGLALTNDAELATHMALLRSHGITRDAEEMTHEPDGPWYYQQIELGFNYRMTDLQAALGLSQLKRLDAFVARRHKLAGFYRQYLAGSPVVVQSQPEDCYSALHLFVIRLQLDDCKKSHREVFCCLREAGIGANLHYIPVHLQPYYQQRGFKPGDFPQAERYYAEAMSLPLYPDLIEAQQLHVVATLRASV
ncbi:UDP-4-amino-4,6-dideoxy-N-acetyl-beta-L-altrosamine transaminase [Methylomonas methanica]|uniref:UDP-4-keto-6-deoxy-N-acetylglucosamine 4-aminotransferase n=1 Tax=Methylomonas methanica (strain DSM 25384 / MC09) TaxID=857087 RepID=F9ZZF6_METMM|nr:UDP-4-amino-4,6-dideoxy-N-acetyl-beta-L-altrosamine transaminase [Methylomonas methanica]AEG02349.1 UDP-4-keto-6-deoxy-N-acetylglucosamine 4-aminotransferase [Methylomonas methanica MC09]